MTTICPKCHHLRQPNEAVPDWQCPACGVAYAKAGDAGRGVVTSAQSFRRLDGNDSGFAWGKLVLLAAVLWGAWAGWGSWQGRTGGLNGGSMSQGSAAQKWVRWRLRLARVT